MFFVGRGAYVAFKTRVSGSWWIAATLVGVFYMGLQDTYTFIFAEDEEWIAQGFISQYSAILILLCFFGHLGQRFVNALNETDLLNRELEGRVALKEQELQGIYDKALQLEVEKSTLRQREQIYRDLHDDVGAKLVSIIQAAEENKSSNYARAALESLRAAIFQAKYPELALAQLLDGCKEEALLRAEVMGKELRWQQTGEVPIQLASETSYHLTRIIREAISNSLKFGMNSPIEVLVELLAGCLHLTIRNSVYATEPALSGFSSGLTNIRFRAETIGAEIEWHAAELEMQFTLSLPLPEGSLTADIDPRLS
jgi:signal transduction histidine kinase